MRRGAEPVKSPETLARLCLTAGSIVWPAEPPGSAVWVPTVVVGTATVPFVKRYLPSSLTMIGDEESRAKFISEFVRVVSDAIREAIDQQCRFGLGESPVREGELDEAAEVINSLLINVDQANAIWVIRKHIDHLKAQVVFLSRETGAAEAYAKGRAEADAAYERGREDGTSRRRSS